jgi:large subunit ribosomal protein L37Ae
MTQHIKKIGIVSKYGTRYSTSLQKMVKKIELSQPPVHLLLLWQNREGETGYGVLALWFLHETVAGGAWIYTSRSSTM